MSDSSEEYIVDIEDPTRLVIQTEGGRKPKGASPHDVAYNIIRSGPTVQQDTEAAELYAVTVNIRPSQLMNKRRWKTYSNDAQRCQLLRIEAAFRSKNPSIQLREIHFELCPNIEPPQVHFHALYEMPPSFVNHYILSWEKHNTIDAKTLNPWRVVIVKECGDESGWLQYIRKEAAADH